MYVETEQHETSSADPTDGVQEVEGLCYHVELGLAVGLVTKVVLGQRGWENEGGE